MPASISLGWEVSSGLRGNFRRATSESPRAVKMDRFAIRAKARNLLFDTLYRTAPWVLLRVRSSLSARRLDAAR